MNWPDLGGALIKAGAPIIGRALGGPLGGVIGDAIGGVLADALGTEASPEAVGDALAKTPAGELQGKLAGAEAEALARWPALAEIVKADVEAQVRALGYVNETMRAEAASGDLVQRWWRPAYALELILECVAVWIVALADLKFNGGKISAFVLSAQGLLTTYWTARFGVLGVYVGGRSIEKLAGVAQQVSPGAMDRMARAVRRK
jgi:hypothetical protein